MPGLIAPTWAVLSSNRRTRRLIFSTVSRQRLTFTCLNSSSNHPKVRYLQRPCVRVASRRAHIAKGNSTARRVYACCPTGKHQFGNCRRLHRLRQEDCRRFQIEIRPQTRDGLRSQVDGIMIRSPRCAVSGVPPASTFAARRLVQNILWFPEPRITYTSAHLSCAEDTKARDAKENILSLSTHRRTHSARNDLFFGRSGCPSDGPHTTATLPPAP